MTATETVNAQGLLTNLKTVKGSATIRNMDFVFNAATGNLDSRTGMMAQKETFYYEHHFRLNKVNHGTPEVLAMTINYEANGNTGLGHYTYNSTKKHAVEYIANTAGLLNSQKQSIGYNVFQKTDSLENIVNNDACRLEIFYGPDQ